MKLLKLSLIAAVLALASSVQAKTQAISAFLPDSADIKWEEAKPLTGAKLAVLVGDPTKKGPFVVRIKLPANYTCELHSHPVNEYDTVISGTWYLGEGTKVDMDKTIALTAGSFVVLPAHSWHYGKTKEETVIQISGNGPWGMIYPKKG